MELIDRAVDLPPGPQLSAVLAGLAWEQVPNARLVEVLQARSRQLAHEQAELLAGLAEIARAVPVAKLPAGDPGAVARAADDFEWASHEIAAGLTWTPTAADRELAFALVLRELPAGVRRPAAGRDRPGKAKVFADHLDPGRRGADPGADPQAVRAVRAARAAADHPAVVPAVAAGDRGDRPELPPPPLPARRFRNAESCCTWTATAPRCCPAKGCRRTRRPPRQPGWTGWPRPRNAPGIPGGSGRSTPICTSACSMATFHGLTEAQILDHLLAHPRPEDADDNPGDDRHADAGVEADAGAEPTRTDAERPRQRDRRQRELPRERRR